MPKIHEIDGKNYYLVTDIDGKYLAKADVESTIADRTSASAKKAREAEAALTEVQAKLTKAEKRTTMVDSLAEQVETLKGQLASAESRYERHTAVAAAGITDPDVRELVEWQYERATKDLGDKAPALADWLKTQISAPDKAPASLRPHLAGLKESGDDKGGQGEGGKGGQGEGGDDKGGQGEGGKGDTLSVARWMGSGRGLQTGNGGEGITLDKIAGAETEEQLAALEKAAGF